MNVHEVSVVVVPDLASAKAAPHEPEHLRKLVNVDEASENEPEITLFTYTEPEPVPVMTPLKEEVEIVRAPDAPIAMKPEAWAVVVSSLAVIVTFDTLEASDVPMRREA